MMGTSWFGFDLDGTLAVYDGWKGPTHIGPPVPLMLARLRLHLDNGDACRIVTARVSGGRGGQAAAARRAVQRWCKEHVGRVLRVTNRKDYQMVALYDDRCKQVVPNTGELLEERLERAERAERASALRGRPPLTPGGTR